LNNSTGLPTRLCAANEEHNVDVRFRVGFDPMAGKKKKRAKRPLRGIHALKIIEIFQFPDVWEFQSEGKRK
jgi:hypothetical protein